MGFSISWLAFQGISKQEVLARLAFRGTEEPCDAYSVSVSATVVGSGWCVVVFRHVSSPFVERTKLAELSRGCDLLVCQAEEHMMASGARLYENGICCWSLDHFSSKGIYDLAIEGMPPVFFDGIRQRLTKQQDEASGKTPKVDFIFDIPVETAAALCGYRHDLLKPEWANPTFTRLEPRE